MSRPACLTGDKQAIDEFIDKFDVSCMNTSSCNLIVIVRVRHFYLTVMVFDHRFTSSMRMEKTMRAK